MIYLQKEKQVVIISEYQDLFDEFCVLVTFNKKVTNTVFNSASEAANFAFEVENKYRQKGYKYNNSPIWFDIVPQIIEEVNKSK